MLIGCVTVLFLSGVYREILESFRLSTTALRDTVFRRRDALSSFHGYFGVLGLGLATQAFGLASCRFLLFLELDALLDRQRRVESVLQGPTTLIANEPNAPRTLNLVAKRLNVKKAGLPVYGDLPQPVWKRRRPFES